MSKFSDVFTKITYCFYKNYVDTFYHINEHYNKLIVSVSVSDSTIICDPCPGSVFYTGGSVPYARCG